jgi:hypothetical protein
MKMLLAVAAVACLASSVAASAQLMGARELTTATPMKGMPSAKPVADIYYLVGEMGAAETYTLTVKGPASLTLFSPGGHEILTAQGSGTVKLTVHLPATDVFTLAVARKHPSQPYSLSRKATIPTLAEAMMAGGAGVEGSFVDKNGKEVKISSCWITPGVRLRLNYASVTDQYTLAADRSTVLWVSRDQSRVTSGQATYSIDGSMVDRLLKTDDGRSFHSKIELDDTTKPDAKEISTGYLCAGAAGK